MTLTEDQESVVRSAAQELLDQHPGEYVHVLQVAAHPDVMAIDSATDVSDFIHDKHKWWYADPDYRLLRSSLVPAYGFSVFDESLSDDLALKKDVLRDVLLSNGDTFMTPEEIWSKLHKPKRFYPALIQHFLETWGSANLTQTASVEYPTGAWKYRRLRQDQMKLFMDRYGR